MLVFNIYMTVVLNIYHVIVQHRKKINTAAALSCLNTYHVIVQLPLITFVLI
ncbi:hypothetical protein P5E74_07040 [Clostridium perfringens]|nr:hypothetical protein [Clostridium perfringens]